MIIFEQIDLQIVHADRDKSLDSLSVNYSWYKRKLLQLFTSLCERC